MFRCDNGSSWSTATGEASHFFYRESVEVQATYFTYQLVRLLQNYTWW